MNDKLKNYITALGAIAVSGVNALITVQLMLIGGMIGVPMWFTAVMVANTYHMGYYGISKLIKEYKNDCSK